MRLRPAFTVAELIASLVVTSAIVGLATHAIVGQLRFLGGLAAVGAVRSQLAQASGLARAVLWPVAPSDIVVAQDSALELRATIGSAIVCAAAVGSVTVPAPAAGSGNALSSFVQMPGVGDRLLALFVDSLGSTWLSVELSSTPVATPGCLAIPAASPAWRLSLREQVALTGAAVVRVQRPIRLSVYKASDKRWYLGVRDWNGATRKFNAIQPVAGPLMPYTKDAATTGLAFTYRDTAGRMLAPPADPARIASVALLLRGQAPHSVRGDSLTLVVALRNSR